MGLLLPAPGHSFSGDACRQLAGEGRGAAGLPAPSRPGADTACPCTAPLPTVCCMGLASASGPSLSPSVLVGLEPRPEVQPSRRNPETLPSSSQRPSGCDHSCTPSYSQRLAGDLMQVDRVLVNPVVTPGGPACPLLLEVSHLQESPPANNCPCDLCICPAAPNLPLPHLRHSTVCRGLSGLANAPVPSPSL